jgi:7-cyano-7-deazaguanine reductase
MNTPATADPAEFARAEQTPTRELIESSAASLSLLGQSRTEYPKHPDEAKLECIPNAFQGKGSYNVHLDCPEFTAVCPKTGQPDFATIEIDYTPDKLLIESKALKLYLFAFRNVGMFHEFVVNKIAHDLWKAMKPIKLVVTGRFMPRGGISIVPTVSLPNREMLQQARDALSRLDRELRDEVNPQVLLPHEG